MYSQLPPHWKFDPLTQGSFPESLASEGTHDQNLIRHRAHHLFFPSVGQCLLCDHDTPNTTLHKLLQCPDPFRVRLRNLFWNTLETEHPAGYEFLQNSPLSQQLNIILGLLHSSDVEAQKAISLSSKYLTTML
jgi:hypothetical protein